MVRQINLGHGRLTTDDWDTLVQKMTQIQKLIRMAWQFLREASGENAYARYRTFALRHGHSPMSPEAFYLSQLQKKYSRPNRCC